MTKKKRIDERRKQKGEKQQEKQRGKRRGNTWENIRNKKKKQEGRRRGQNNRKTKQNRWTDERPDAKMTPLPLSQVRETAHKARATYAHLNVAAVYIFSSSSPCVASPTIWAASRKTCFAQAGKPLSSCKSAHRRTCGPQFPRLVLHSLSHLPRFL